ncbi:hypothetical protein ACLESO_53855, partial [Pyxidicoccus sp. 3LG]
MKRSGAKIVNYADDFVVVARRGTAEVLAQVTRWLVGMRLTLNVRIPVMVSTHSSSSRAAV